MTNILLSYLARYVPETLILLTLMASLYLEATYHRGERDRFWMVIAVSVGLLVTFITLIPGLHLATPELIFSNSVNVDPFSTFLKMLMVVSTAAIFWLNYSSKDILEGMKGEFIIMALTILVGGMLLASANNLLTLYLGIETLSISSYVMASFKRSEHKSSEAGLKYVMYGGLSSGVMLFGMAQMFGVFGSIQFADIATKLTALSSVQTYILIPSLILFFVGLGYKLACVPFHMWAPDVYEGSPIPVTAFFSIVPKLAALGALVRFTALFFTAGGVLQTTWIGLITVISALTMTVGNIAALEQSSVKRMLAYSSISHAGLLLAGTLVLGPTGHQAILFYGLVYTLMTLSAFLILNFVSNSFNSDALDRFSGLIFKHPFIAICMSITLFSLAGLPPMSGFTAKFNIISGLVQSKYYTLAFVAGLNSVISLFYYLKIVRLMVFKSYEFTTDFKMFNFLNQLWIGIVTIPIFVLGIFWNQVMAIAAAAKLF